MCIEDAFDVGMVSSAHGHSDRCVPAPAGFKNQAVSQAAFFRFQAEATGFVALQYIDAGVIQNQFRLVQRKDLG